jgi:flagellar basal-body rod modification protein FlgD
MVNGVTNTASTSANTATTTAAGSSSELGKNDFLKLMMAQMQNQDPMNPMDGTQFAAQLAQFSSLEQLTNLNDNVTKSINANYVLTQSINNTLSATLIGKQVKVGGSDLQNNGQQNVQIGYNLPSNAGSIAVNIYDANGAIVRTISNVSGDIGDHKLSWDFTDNNGNKLPQGNYTFKIDAKAIDGSDLQTESYKFGTIDGIKFGSNGTQLLVDNSEYGLSDILEIINPSNNGGN